MSAAADPVLPNLTSQTLREELRPLRQKQDAAMALAIYVGMTPAQAKDYDARSRRIREIYETLLVLDGRHATQY